jgi:Ni/Fe-hydrogenase subunit HybB-like protein
METTSFVFPNDPSVAWSIMIVLYPLITGLVAGAFVVSALYHVFHKEELKPVARLALVTSLCFCSFATVPLLLHLHHPERAFNILFTPSATSAMAGFGFIYSLYMLVLIVEVWLVFRPEIVALAQSSTGPLRWIYRIVSLGAREVSDRSRAIDQWIVHALALAGIPIACVLHGYVGFLFGAIKANPWWSTALMPVIFLVSAIVSGVGALVLLYQFICWRRGEAPDANCVRSLTRYLWLFLVLAFTLEMLELIHMAYESDEEWHIISLLLRERLAFSYGIIQVLLGSIVPLVLLLIAGYTRLRNGWLYSLSALGSALVIVQVFAMRWNVVIGGQMFSKSFRGFVEYHLEWGGREGAIAAGVVLLMPLVALWVAMKLLPVFGAKDSTAA